MAVAPNQNAQAYSTFLSFFSLSLSHTHTHTHTTYQHNTIHYKHTVLGKAEGEGELWHGHVTAVTVGPPFRRQGLAQKLMNLLEDVTDHVHNAYFVDLFVRVSNTAAIEMYKAVRFERM